MGYLQEFAAKLEELLHTRGLTEAQRDKIIAYVKEHVLQSYRNGVEKGRAESASSNTKPAPRKAWRPAKRTR
jgi:hypothetical protein